MSAIERGCCHTGRVGWCRKHWFVYWCLALWDWQVVHFVSTRSCWTEPSSILHPFSKCAKPGICMESQKLNPRSTIKAFLSFFCLLLFFKFLLLYYYIYEYRRFCMLYCRLIIELKVLKILFLKYEDMIKKITLASNVISKSDGVLYSLSWIFVKSIKICEN